MLIKNTTTPIYTEVTTSVTNHAHVLPLSWLLSPPLLHKQLHKPKPLDWLMSGLVLHHPSPSRSCGLENTKLYRCTLTCLFFPTGQTGRHVFFIITVTTHTTVEEQTLAHGCWCCGITTGRPGRVDRDWSAPLSSWNCRWDWGIKPQNRGRLRWAD